MPGKRIIAVLFIRLLSLYDRKTALSGGYITKAVSTILFIIQNHRYRQASLITKEGLNAMGRNNKIATDNGAPE